MHYLCAYLIVINVLMQFCFGIYYIYIYLIVVVLHSGVMPLLGAVL